MRKTRDIIHTPYYSSVRLPAQHSGTGTHTSGGTEMTTGVTATGTPGTDGQTQIVIGANTPSVLYFYCTVHSGMGRYNVSPDRFGTINVHDYWHLDRVSKQDRQYLNNTFSYNESADGVDIYVLCLLYTSDAADE